MAVDQGGCVETTRETTHDDPVYDLHGVIHYAVGNVPGAVPHTSTYALTNATLPYVVELAERGVRAAVEEDRSLLAGVATVGGMLTSPAVAEALDRKVTDPLEALAAS
jgi:alanine dehydrogenase